MSASLRTEISGEAERQIREADAWWREHRPLARNAIREEFGRVRDLISDHPGLGAPVRDTTLPHVRRLYIERINYYVYYRIVGVPKYIEILAFWGSRRGGPPPV
jgi:hypothetical protein